MQSDTQVHRAEEVPARTRNRCCARWDAWWCFALFYLPSILLFLSSLNLFFFAMKLQHPKHSLYTRRMLLLYFDRSLADYYTHAVRDIMADWAIAGGAIGLVGSIAPLPALIQDRLPGSWVHMAATGIGVPFCAFFTNKIALNDGMQWLDRGRVIASVNATFDENDLEGVERQKDSINNVWAHIQQPGQCCGGNDYRDWMKEPIIRFVDKVYNCTEMALIWSTKAQAEAADNFRYTIPSCCVHPMCCAKMSDLKVNMTGFAECMTAACALYKDIQNGTIMLESRPELPEVHQRGCSEDYPLLYQDVPFVQYFFAVTHSNRVQFLVALLSFIVLLPYWIRLHVLVRQRNRAAKGEHVDDEGEDGKDNGHRDQRETKQQK